MNDTWNQFGGNETGSGFRLVNGAPLSGVTWHANLPAAVTTSSPVIGPDGTVYVGTLDGKLTAFGPRGAVKWSVQIGPGHTSVATPAVASDGTIYCLCTSIVRDHRLGPPLPPQPGPANFVVSVSADGAIRWTVPVRALSSEFNWDTGQIHGAPRIVSQGSKARVIFVIRYELQIVYSDVGPGPQFRAVLAIVDEHGTFLLFHPYETEKLFVEVTGGGGFGSGGATIADPVDRNAVPLSKSAMPYTDTPAVFGNVRSKDAWTIVAPGRLGLYAIRWNDSQGALASPAALVWKGESPTSPCAFPNGLITAFPSNVVTILEKDTFTPYAAHPVHFLGTGTVAGGLRQMYFLTRPFGELFLIDANGSIVRKVELHADSVAYPALAADCVYVSTARGIRRYSLDLTTLLADLTFPPGPPGGVSSPAIGANGSIYFINQFQGRHVLYAYEHP